jgi:6-pyruvoyltetrahydropterin/6-carboxytetrahydropterin synthase
MSKSRLSTIELFKEEMKFSAGHFTIFPPNDEVNGLPIRENLHGHNYNLYASFTTLISDENLGLSYDYRFYKEKLYNLCQQLNETVILPGNCKYLSIFDKEKYYHIHFNDEIIIFLKRDVTILPLTNVTVEELSYWYLNQLLFDKNELDKNQITEITMKVFSGPGQSGSACWKK